MNEILMFFIGVCLGSIISLSFVALEIKREKRRNYNKNTNFFKNIYSSLVSNGQFVSRVNDNVDISIIFEGKVHNVIYIMDKSEIAIFLGKECLSISSGIDVDRQVIGNIIFEINSRWGKKIKSVVNINGSVIDSTTYNRITSNFTPEEGPKLVNSSTFNLDDILDKIGQVGYENLSDEEKEFLTKIK